MKSKTTAESPRRPGFLLFFEDLRPAVDRFSDEDLGKLIRAVFEYADKKKVSTLEGQPGLLFDIIRPKLDRDEESYRAVCRQRQYAAYSRETRRQGGDPIPFVDWEEPPPF